MKTLKKPSILFLVLAMALTACNDKNTDDKNPLVNTSWRFEASSPYIDENENIDTMTTLLTIHFITPSTGEINATDMNCSGYYDELTVPLTYTYENCQGTITTLQENLEITQPFSFNKESQKLIYCGLTFKRLQ